MQRRQFLSLFGAAAAAAPLPAPAQTEDTARLVEEIQNLDRRLAELRWEKTELLSAISEMRQPLCIVLGYAKLILDEGCGDVPDEMRRALKSIERGGRHATELINAVFDRSRKSSTAAT